jgi:hypothetical protein
VVVVVVYPEKKNGWAAIRIGISLRHWEANKIKAILKWRTDGQSFLFRATNESPVNTPERQLNSSAHFSIRSVDIFSFFFKHPRVQFFFNSPLCTPARDLNIKRTKNSVERPPRDFGELSRLFGILSGKFLRSSYVTVSLYASVPTPALSFGKVSDCRSMMYPSGGDGIDRATTDTSYRHSTFPDGP